MPVFKTDSCKLTCALGVKLLKSCLDVSQDRAVPSNIVRNLAQGNLLETAIRAKSLQALDNVSA